MLFLVISTPLPERPSLVAADRQRFWHWMRSLLDDGTARSAHARVGRGMVVLFDVDANETLHRLMTEWAEIVPAHFDVYPLVDPDAAQRLLSRPITT